MCGITALFRDLNRDISGEVIEKMTDTIYHRGPDDGGTTFFMQDDGYWQPSSYPSATWRSALGSRRLSIQDVSQAGHMPMQYQNRFWIVYNGEVYNFVEIRSELAHLGHTFRSSSDTEVILAAYAEWGMDCFARFRGMWGLVLVDCLRGEAILCRDRLGIKPLYIWQRPGMMAVVSEIKQLRHIPDIAFKMNCATASEYLRTGYEATDRSFLRDVCPVPAGTWIRVSLDTLTTSSPQDYWHPERITVSVTDAREASQLFAQKLRECVNIHLRSDVPVGCALSGGLDSCSIATLVHQLQRDAQHTQHELHTFTATFPGDAVDERMYVDAVLPAIQATPHFVTPHPATFLEEMDDFLRTHDEPVGSLSVYAGYCIARLTRQANVPVTLNGQGGDEILSGYWQSYFFYLRHLAQQRRFVPLVHNLLGAAMPQGNSTLLTQIPVMLKRFNARRHATPQFRLKMQVGEEHTSILSKVLALDEQSWRLAEIRSMFLPRLLKWDDRNSMAFSVEGRYPFLDHELIDLCLSFAPHTLYHYGWTKCPLRIGLQDVLPQSLLTRRSKVGFEVPQDKWLCGPLRPTLENWLTQDRPLWKYVERADVQRLAHTTWQLSLRNREVTGQTLFRLFMFDRWMDLFHVKDED